MPSAAKTVSPSQAADLSGQGRAVMVDIPEPDELARRHFKGARSQHLSAGLPVTENRKAPLEMMRQVQIGAGSLVLLGVALGYGAHPGFFGLSGAVGAGLLMAGVTGFCGLARLLDLAPWNRAVGS